MTGNPEVYVEKVTSLDENMDNLINHLSSGLKNEINNIAIKLNLCDFRTPETGVVSDPAMVEAMMKSLCRLYPTASIYLIENDATSVKADIMFRYLGFDKLTEKYGARVINLANEKWEKKKIDGYHFKSLSVPVILRDCDLFITHPKLKTHSTCKITCGLKNVYGCYRRRRKVSYHGFLDEAIVDINLAITPGLSIVDANICQEGVMGPTYGYPRRLGLLIGGKDPVAVDAFCARLAGFNPRFVGHIHKAAKKGLGKLNYNVVCTDNLNLSEYKLDFNKSLFYLLKLFKMTTTH